MIMTTSLGYILIICVLTLTAKWNVEVKLSWIHLLFELGDDVDIIKVFNFYVFVLNSSFFLVAYCLDED